MIKVMAFGTFDILHQGHIYYLGEAKKFGDYLIVVVARDTTVEKVKGKKPLYSEDTRLFQVSKLEIVNLAILGNVDDKHAVIREFQPDVICLGYDQKHFTQNLKQSFPQIKIYRIGSIHPKKYKSSKIKIAILANQPKNL